MEFFKRINPAYKSARVYKTASGRAAKSPSSSGLLSMFAVAPSYKTAVPVVVAEGSLDGDELAAAAEAAQVADAGDAGPDDEGAVCELAADEIVLL